MALAALAVLALNDHWLKGAGIAPGWLTGKLSDVAGLVFFPLLLTASLDCALLAIARLSGARIDFSLRRWKLALAIASTGAAFAALKMIPGLAAAAEDAAATLGWSIRIAADPTDLLALPALAVAAALGEAEIARVPLGRLEVIERSGRREPEAIAAALADVGRRHRGEAVRDLAAGLAAWWAGGDPNAARDALHHLRRGSHSRACP